MNGAAAGRRCGPSDGPDGVGRNPLDLLPLNRIPDLADGDQTPMTTHSHRPNRALAALTVMLPALLVVAAPCSAPGADAERERPDGAPPVSLDGSLAGSRTPAAAPARTPARAPARAPSRAEPARPAPAAEPAPAPRPIPGLTDKLGLDTKPGADLLGEPYENPVAGIAFRPPAGLSAVRATDAESIAEFNSDDGRWLLKVTKAKLSKPMPLQTVKEKGAERIGLLDFTVSDIKSNLGSPQFMRNQVINVGPNSVGIVVVRFNIGTEKFLRQQALFQSSESLYYVFNLTTPAAKAGRPEDDPGERRAALAFKDMIDTIQLLDRSWIKQDQVNRLFRTRALFTVWSDKNGKALKDAILPEQWLRVIRDGKDVGYTYIVEEALEGRDIKDNPGRAFDGVLISVRTRMIDKGAQVDLGSQMFVSLDRRHEDWAHVINLVKNKGQADEDKQQSIEYGFSQHKLIRRLDEKGLVPIPEAGKRDNPPVREIDSYKLSVVRPARSRNTPLAKPEYYTPSPWYIPQGVGAMLPRLLPVNRPVTYLFQSYVSEQQEVVHRYVDVGFEKEVTLRAPAPAERLVTAKAVPISDRIRLEGSPTVHYMSVDGKYLGSYNEEAKVTILPSSAEELKKIWKDPNLNKQEEIQRPEAPR